jgi:hypothetical protein
MLYVMKLNIFRLPGANFVSGKNQPRLLPFSSPAGSDFASKSFSFSFAHALVTDLHVNIQLVPAGKYIPRDRLIVISSWNWYMEGIIYKHKGFDPIA